MSFLNSIKDERRMSLNHWRYKLLHWAFRVKEVNPHCPTESGLPSFLYTHYCPLFHITNLIAIFSPIILLIRCIILLFCALGSLIDLIPIGLLTDIVMKLKPKSSQEATVKEKKVTIEEEREKFISFLYSLHHIWWKSFENCWTTHGGDSCFTLLSKQEAEQLFEFYKKKFEEAHKRAELRKKRWKEKIIFWTRISEVFIKWALNIAYVGLGILVLGLTYLLAGGIWWCLCSFADFISWLFTDGVSWSFFVFFGKMMLWFSGVPVFLYFLFKFQIFQKFVTKVWEGIEYIKPPVYLVVVPFRWVVAGFKNTCEFVSMFYEANCPPIKLVTPEEAKMEGEEA